MRAIPFGRESDALRQADQFREIAEETKDVTGGLGDMIIDTGHAAGNMMAAHGLFSMASAAANSAGITSALEETAAPLSPSSTAAKNAAATTRRSKTVRASIRRL